MYINKDLFCDLCGEIITTSNLGHLVWEYENKKNLNFQILHKKLCTTDLTKKKTLELDSIFNNCIPKILEFLVEGDESNGIFIPNSNVKEIIEILMRFILPKYEDARRYWDQAINDGIISGDFSENNYNQINLEQIISTYQNK